MRIPTPSERPTVSIPEAGKCLSLGRAASYAAAQRGEIPTIRFGRRLVVPVPALRAKLGLEPDPQPEVISSLEKAAA